MKVLSIKEPYASLIKDGIKMIETRSWKTNYRGELFIHASKATVNKETKNNKKLMELVRSPYAYGKIICKCRLVDCVYMTDDFIDKIKNDNYQEYICGYYDIGRYAWILDDIEIIDKISCNGKLGIWNFDKDVLN